MSTKMYNLDGGFEPRGFVLNASDQQYSSSGNSTIDKQDGYGLKPLDNFNGKVFIAHGTFKVYQDVYTNSYDINGIKTTNVENILVNVPRAKVIFHELRESLLRTAFGDCYEEAHAKAGGAAETSVFYPSLK